MTSPDSLSPNQREVAFLTLVYNKFYDIFEELFSEGFNIANSYYRYERINQLLSIYCEILKYTPLTYMIEDMKTKRPPMEAELASEFVNIIRHVIVHFRIFDNWDEVWIQKDIVTWKKEGRQIDKFFRKYEGHQPVKARFWEQRRKKMTCAAISFPSGYSAGDKIYLKDMISEFDGVRLIAILLRQVINTQVESITE